MKPVRDYLIANKFYIFLALLVLAGFFAAVYYDRLVELGSFLALSGGFVALFTYLQTQKIKRLEWLLQLFHRYMDEKKFRRIRYIIVFRVQPEYTQLRDLMQHRAERKVDRPVSEFDNSLIMDMDDYLNFFELIATLWKKQELRRSEIETLYHDYIKYLWQIDFTHAYITNWGFESLTRLATELFGPGPLADSTAPTSN